MLSILLAFCVVTSLPLCHSVCLPCFKEVCSDLAQNCTLVPAFDCPEINHCSAGVVKDECGCCDVCAKTIGEKCHEGPATLQWRGGCAKGLKCVPAKEGTADLLEGFDDVNHYTVGRCEPETQECRDPITSRSYRAGSLWSHGDFACTTCLCSRNGRSKCSRILCNSSDCEERMEGRCCSFCFETDWNTGCRFDGETYFNHESIVLPDYHTVCKCQESKWSCTENLHKHALSVTEKPLCVNHVSGEPLRAGEIWRPSDCAHCMCDRNGRGSCSYIKCPQPRCQEPVKLRDRCCLVCPQDYVKACHYNLQKYLPGEKISLPDRCTLCTCENTGWRCSNENCDGLTHILEPISFD